MNTPTEAVRRVLTHTPKTVGQIAQAAGSDTRAVTIALAALKAGGIAVCTPGEGLMSDETWSLAQRPR